VKWGKGFWLSSRSKE